MTRFMDKAQWSPAGANWGHYYSEEAQALITAAFGEFDPVKREAILIKMHEKMVDDAVMLWVVHDINPRANPPRSQGFVQAQAGSRTHPHNHRKVGRNALWRPTTAARRTTPAARMSPWSCGLYSILGPLMLEHPPSCTERGTIDPRLGNPRPGTPIAPPAPMFFPLRQPSRSCEARH